MSKKIQVPQFKPCIDVDDATSMIRSVLHSGYITEGPRAADLLVQLTDLIGSDYGFYAPNGTLALALGMLALNIGPGDEVLVPNITFIASANAVTLTGASPRPVEIVAFDNPTIDVERIELRENTKALMIAPLFGTAPSNLESIISFAKRHGLLLIEDAAQCIGVQGPLGHLGSFGAFGAFSFYADKTITLGEGGFLVTNDAELADKITLLRNQGRRHSGTFVHESIGYNFRITDMQAALGLSQFATLDETIAKKNEIARRYQTHLQGLLDSKEISLLHIRDDYTYVPFRVVMFSKERDKVLAAFEAAGIQGRAMFYPIHRQPGYKKKSWAQNQFPISDQCSERGICLPTWIGIPDDDIKYVCDVVTKTVRS